MAIERLLESKPILQKVFSMYHTKLVLGIIFVFLFDVHTKTSLGIVLYLTIFDFITGFSAAKYTGEVIKSSKIFRTCLKIFLYFGIISSAYLFERAVGINIGADNILIVFFAFTEFISILENFAKLGLKLPGKLLNIINAFKGSVN